MLECPPKPVCPGEVGAPPAVPSPQSRLEQLKALAMQAWAAATAVYAFLTQSASVATLLGFIPTNIALSAITGAVVGMAYVSLTYWNRCLETVEGPIECASGVVQEVVPSFGSWTDTFNPVAAMHHRVNLVTKCRYWPLIQTPGTETVVCNGDPDYSPVLQVFYYDPEVCAAGKGATIGAAAAVVPGIIVACLIGAAIGCATIVWCAVAVAVAALVAAGAVLAGAFIGGNIGRAVADSTQPEAGNGSALQTGDYISVTGTLIISGDLGAANVFWFALQTSIHGVSPAGRSNGVHRYSHMDPDDLEQGLVRDECHGRPGFKPSNDG